MGTDVPVQHDGASDAREGALEDQSVRAESRHRKEHKEKDRAKRPREGKEKESHKHSKHRRKSKSSHQSPDGKTTRTVERFPSPAGKLCHARHLAIHLYTGEHLHVPLNPRGTHAYRAYSPAVESGEIPAEEDGADVSSLNALNPLSSTRNGEDDPRPPSSHHRPTANDANLQASSRSQSTDRPRFEQRMRNDSRTDRNLRDEPPRDSILEDPQERPDEKRRRERGRPREHEHESAQRDDERSRKEHTRHCPRDREGPLEREGDRSRREDRPRERKDEVTLERDDEQRRKEGDRQSEGDGRRHGTDAEPRSGSRSRHSPTPRRTPVERRSPTARRTPAERSWRNDDAGYRGYRGYRGHRDREQYQPYRGGDVRARDGRSRDAREGATRGVSDRGRDYKGSAPARPERPDWRGAARRSRDGSDRRVAAQNDNTEGDQLLAKYEEMMSAEEREVCACFSFLCVFGSVHLQ